VLRQNAREGTVLKLRLCLIPALNFTHASRRRVMPHNSELLRIQPEIIVNIRNIAYVELTGK
jgi:hypothetical protein